MAVHIKPTNMSCRSLSEKTSKKSLKRFFSAEGYFLVLKSVHLPRLNCAHSTSLLLVSWWSWLRHLVLLLQKNCCRCFGFKLPSELPEIRLKKFMFKRSFWPRTLLFSDTLCTYLPTYLFRQRLCSRLKALWRYINFVLLLLLLLLYHYCRFFFTPCLFFSLYISVYACSTNVLMNIDWYITYSSNLAAFGLNALFVNYNSLINKPIVSNQCHCKYQCHCLQFRVTHYHWTSLMHTLSASTMRT